MLHLRQGGRACPLAHSQRIGAQRVRGCMRCHALGGGTATAAHSLRPRARSLQVVGNKYDEYLNLLQADYTEGCARLRCAS
jgi:hypothetical protein